MNELPPDTTADLVISLAGVTDVDFALEYPKVAVDKNVALATDVVEWVRRVSPAARTIFVSTDEVLGESETPLRESAPLRPTQPYAASKAAAEIIIQTYASAYGLDIVIARSCNLVGPHQNARKLIPVAVRCLTASRAIPVFGTGDCVREWLSVEDLCSALVLLSDSAREPGIYHVGSGIRRTANEVITLVAAALSRDIMQVTVPDRRVHDRSYALCSNKIRAEGWSPIRDPIDAIREAAVSLAVTQPWRRMKPEWLLWPELAYHG